MAFQQASSEVKHVDNTLRWVLRRMVLRSESEVVSVVIIILHILYFQLTYYIIWTLSLGWSLYTSVSFCDSEVRIFLDNFSLLSIPTVFIITLGIH